MTYQSLTPTLGLSLPYRVIPTSDLSGIPGVTDVTVISLASVIVVIGDIITPSYPGIFLSSSISNMAVWIHSAHSDYSQDAKQNKNLYVKREIRAMTGEK